MKALHRKRLEKLATHLEKGKLAHDSFDFSTLHDHRGCRSVGCALGECPFVFPNHWHMAQTFPKLTPLLKISPFGSSTGDAVKFFGISDSAAEHLFHPYLQSVDLYGGKRLSAGATRKQVAANIRAFIKRQSKPAKAKAGGSSTTNP
jgi:hypothetical protein